MYIAGAPARELHADRRGSSHEPLSIQCCNQKVFPPSRYIRCGFQSIRASSPSVGGKVDDDTVLSVVSFPCFCCVLVLEEEVYGCLIEESSKSSVTASTFTVWRKGRMFYYFVNATVTIIKDEKGYSAGSLLGGHTHYYFKRQS